MQESELDDIINATNADIGEDELDALEAAADGLDEAFNAELEEASEEISEETVVVAEMQEEQELKEYLHPSVNPMDDPDLVEGEKDVNFVGDMVDEVTGKKKKKAEAKQVILDKKNQAEELVGRDAEDEEPDTRETVPETDSAVRISNPARKSIEDDIKGLLIGSPDLSKEDQSIILAARVRLKRKPLFTTGEVGKILGISRPTVKRLIRDGELTGGIVGANRWMITAVSLNQYVKKRLGISLEEASRWLV